MKAFNKIVEEVLEVGNKLDEQQIELVVNEVQNANHIFFAGEGRSGLMLRAFANRLLHLDFSVSIVGDITSPHTKRGDLLLIGSGSGTTASLVNLAIIAKNNSVKIGLITTNPESIIGQLADLVIVVPTQSKDTQMATLQPMGSLFEQTTLFIYDSMILILMKKMNESNQTMSKRHTDLE